MDVALVRDLIAAVDESGIDTLEISRSGIRIRISKSPRPLPVTLSAPVAAPAVANPPASSNAAAETVTPPAPAAAPDAATAPSNLVEVRSPMVGTFYRAPAPEAPPYVEPGTAVSTGQTLCILEAMKLMNELPSELDGIVREIHVENGSPVEYGQLLFRIERTSATA
ncbi:MAG: acetyl-CoA carboxylase biotin carboxyl carrier protein [Gemmatimonadetes bacterium]|nr:acetyl-CoA carboxylase biotin carboxyl carrier protein [Gemmatimonadota bacterium]